MTSGGGGEDSPAGSVSAPETLPQAWLLVRLCCTPAFLPQLLSRNSAWGERRPKRPHLGCSSAQVLPFGSIDFFFPVFFPNEPLQTLWPF